MLQFNFSKVGSYDGQYTFLKRTVRVLFVSSHSSVLPEMQTPISVTLKLLFYL